MFIPFILLMKRIFYYACSYYYVDRRQRDLNLIRKSNHTKVFKYNIEISAH